MPKNRSRGPEAVSPELDTLSCDLIETALDALADGSELGVIAAYENASGTRNSQVFDEDSPDACIDAAHSYIRSRKDAVRYGIVYDGAVARKNGAFEDAVILEFGEKGHDCAFSAYVLYRSAGNPDRFSWADPEPAGELKLLI